MENSSAQSPSNNMADSSGITAGTTSGVTSDMAEEPQNETLQAAQEKIGAFRQAAAKRCRELDEAARSYVVKRPGTSVATVALVSLALGVLIGRNRPARW